MILTKLKKFKQYLLKRKFLKMGVRFGRNFKCMARVNFGSEPYLICIGNDVTVSFDVAFITHDGATSVFRKKINKAGGKYGPIKIGSNCFIGAKAIIMPGVTLGDNCIVAAGAVVTKSFPENSCIGGVPAKLICSTSDYSDKAEKLMIETPGGSDKKAFLISWFGL